MFPIEVFQISLGKLTTTLSSHNIRFHLTGGLTGTAYGEPRMTQDINAAIDQGDLFQLLDEKECLKFDLYPREMIPSELERSEMLEIFEGQKTPVVSRVDAAASKLVWISKGSHKSRRDLRAITRNCTDDQLASVRQHAVTFKLSQLLEDVLKELDEIT